MQGVYTMNSCPDCKYYHEDSMPGEYGWCDLTCNHPEVVKFNGITGNWLAPMPESVRGTDEHCDKWTERVGLLRRLWRCL